MNHRTARQRGIERATGITVEHTITVEPGHTVKVALSSTLLPTDDEGLIYSDLSKMALVMCETERAFLTKSDELGTWAVVGTSV